VGRAQVRDGSDDAATRENCAMSGISFSGLASGIDSTAIISSLVAVERIPQNRLLAQNSALTSKSKIVDQLTSALAALKTAAEGLASPGEFLSYAGSVSNESVAKITTSGSSVPGTYALDEITLAYAQRTYSSPIADADADLSASAQTLSLTIDGTQTDIAIPVGASLRDVAAAINGSGAAASAGVLFDGTQYRLQVVGRNTGADNAITFTDTGLGLNLSVPANTVQAATDASLTIDGFPVTSASNILDDILPGTTIELKNASTDPVQVRIDADPSAVKAKLGKFVEAYNAVARLIAAQNGVGKGTDTLSGDSTVRTIEQGLARLISSPIPGMTGAGGATLQLADLGIQTQRDGTLTLDSDDLDGALAGDFARTATYFAGDGTNDGMGTLLSDLIDGYTDSIDGLLTSRKKGIGEQIASNTDKIEDIETYLERFEASLRQQYAALEQAMSELQGQQSYLAQFLNS
jgi:flagellar hook-associated protein 2